MQFVDPPSHHSSMLWQFLTQPLFSPKQVVLNPIQFWHHYRVQHLERCWKRDSVQLLERCWERDFVQLLNRCWMKKVEIGNFSNQYFWM
ncbi:MAG: hypothetical protein ACAF41_04790 [Leptolyngbya sp. BL-A-14]